MSDNCFDLATPLFMSPAMTLVSAGQTIQEMRTQMERVEDVMEYPTDANVLERDTEVTELAKLLVNVELKGITFGYSRLEKPLIEDFSLSLKTGQRVALVGSSGCGKSTIGRLVSGLYQPWSGEILFDGKPRSAYPREVMVGSLAVVDQDIILFEDTVAGQQRIRHKATQKMIGKENNDLAKKDNIKELELNALEKVAGGANIEPEVDLLDPAQELWRGNIKSSAAARKAHLGTSLEQTIIDIQSDYRSYGMELIHLAEYLTSVWDTL